MRPDFFHLIMHLGAPVDGMQKLPGIDCTIQVADGVYWLYYPSCLGVAKSMCSCVICSMRVFQCFFFRGFSQYIVSWLTIVPYIIYFIAKSWWSFGEDHKYIYIYLCATYTYIFYIFSLYFSSHESHFPSCPASCEKSRMRKAHFYWILLASTPCPRVTNGSSMMQRFKKFRKSKTERRGKQRRNVATSSGLGGWMVWWAACKSLKNVLVFL